MDRNMVIADCNLILHKHISSISASAAKKRDLSSAPYQTCTLYTPYVSDPI